MRQRKSHCYEGDSEGALAIAWATACVVGLSLLVVSLITT
jgi:hypothetical protein